MSANPSGDGTHDESAPIHPPLTTHPLAPLARLVVPGLIAIAIICGVIYGILPLFAEANDANKKLEKMRQQDVENYSRPLKYQGPVAPPRSR